jgi:putative polymerase
MSATLALPEAASPGTAGARMARLVVIGTLLFNLVLAIANAQGFPIREIHVIAAELLLVGMAFLLIWNRGEVFYVIAAALGGWLVFAMVMRMQFDPKVLRDAFIPILFYLLGRYHGSPESGDRLVNAAIALVLAGALFEWLFLDAFLRHVDVIGYYVARGSVEASQAGDEPGLFISGLRFEGRTLLPFLGEHRVSSVFLEPVSLGNFGPIVFAWVLMRDRHRPLALVVKTAIIMYLLVLGDARFGIYLCAAVVLAYLAAPVVRPGLVFAAPFLAIVGLLTYAGMNVGAPWDNSITGRFLFSGQLLSTLDIGQAMGLSRTTVDFVDSGYATMLSQFGLFGATGMWALYVFGAPAETPDSWRYKLFVCLYLILLLSISTSLLTIKTAALLWFLAGASAAGQAPAPKAAPMAAGREGRPAAAPAR